VARILYPFLVRNLEKSFELRECTAPIFGCDYTSLGDTLPVKGFIHEVVHRVSTVFMRYGKFAEPGNRFWTRAFANAGINPLYPPRLGEI